MAVDSIEPPFDMDKAKSFIDAADEMRVQKGWPDGVIDSQRRLMKALLSGEYDGPVWVFFGPDGPLRGDTDSQSSEAVEIRLSGRIKGLFENELSIFSEGGPTTVADWVHEFWLDHFHFIRLEKQWRERHPIDSYPTSVDANHGEVARIAKPKKPHRSPGRKLGSTSLRKEDEELAERALEIFNRTSVNLAGAFARAALELKYKSDKPIDEPWRDVYETARKRLIFKEALAKRS